MSAVTPRVIALLMSIKRETDMIWVQVTDPAGHRFCGRVADLTARTYDPRKADCTIVTEDNTVMWNVLVTSIQKIDVRPRPSGR